MTDDQPRLFEASPAWAEYWRDMPEFEHDGSGRPHDSIRVYFASEQDRREFLQLVGVDPGRRRGIWYPHRPQRSAIRRQQAAVPAGRYPIYVISKGRWETRHTSGALERLGMDYRIVIEPQEYDAYVAHIDPGKILTLPFGNLGKGSIPARNWVWEHAVASGARRHWILDDNIELFRRFNHDRRTTIQNENPLIPCEEFVDRYTNIALAGLQYSAFADERASGKIPPLRFNTRIYSCILVNHAIPFRWRGQYNEDTDLSLRVLKAGWVTVLLNAYLINKVRTMKMAGGNTDELYADDGRRKMAESLREQHPDVVTVTTKWGRPQHHVNYSPFRFNKLIPLEAEGVEAAA